MVTAEVKSSLNDSNLGPTDAIQPKIYINALKVFDSFKRAKEGFDLFMASENPRDATNIYYQAKEFYSFGNERLQWILKRTKRLAGPVASYTRDSSYLAKNREALLNTEEMLLKSSDIEALADELMSDPLIQQLEIQREEVKGFIKQAYDVNDPNSERRLPKNAKLRLVIDKLESISNSLDELKKKAQECYARHRLWSP